MQPRGCACRGPWVAVTRIGGLISGLVVWLVCMQYVPSFAQYELDEFIWARLVVITRIFGLTINGVKTDGLVPMADMLNHKRPRQTKWTFDDERQGFTITSISALQRGDQVFDSYGQKCNSRFFVNYGFALEENEVPEFVSPVLRVVCV